MQAEKKKKIICEPVQFSTDSLLPGVRCYKISFPPASAMRAVFIHGLGAVIALTELICQAVDHDVSCGNHLKLRMMSTLAQI